MIIKSLLSLLFICAIAGAGGKDVPVTRTQTPQTAMTEFQTARTALNRYVKDYNAKEFTGVMIKLTYIGEQNKPYPGLLVSSYYRYADLDAFKQYRQAGVHYDNDDLRVLWHLTTRPELIRTLIIKLKSLQELDRAEKRSGSEDGLSHSLSIIDMTSPNRPNAYEVLLTLKETSTLLRELAKSMEGQDQAAAKLLRGYLTMFGSGI